MNRQELIRAVQELAEKLGRAPSRREAEGAIRGFKYSLYKPENQFQGSLSNLIESAGLTPRSMLRPSATANSHPAIKQPLIPDDDIPVDEIISTMCRRFEKRKSSHDSKKWMEFKVDTDLPIAINFFGDPHIDDDGCNWPLLKKHIDICKNTPGVFGANIGDTHNNWVGRLAKEYANQSTTRSTAWKLIDWFLKDSGVKWLVMLAGNHDDWNYGTETLRKFCENVCPMVDWRAQFTLKFTNGVEVRIDAAHDHAGHSQWNSLHGQQKASTMGGTAHLYIAGHRHNWALAQNECPHTHRVYWLARARGYKEIDDYGEKLGFGTQKSGASVMIVIDPRADEVNRVRCFADPAQGASYLTFLRSQIR